MNYLKNGLSVVSHAINQYGHLTLPVAAGAAVQMSLQDVRIGKFVGGMGLMISGVSLLFASGAPKSLKSLCWTRGNITKKDVDLKIAWRCAVGVMGLAATCYGLYNMVTGILESTTANSTLIYQAFDEKPSNHQSNSNRCTKSRLIKAREQIFSCPEAKTLWDTVKSEGLFTIKCVTKNKAPEGARTWVDTRQIFISRDNEDLVPSLIFELNNLKRSATISSIYKDKCLLDVDSFALAVEALEYETAKDTHAIIDHCIKTAMWPSDLNRYQKQFSGNATHDWRTFEGYLKTQEEYGHTDGYRDGWYEKCNPGAYIEWVESKIAQLTNKIHELKKELL